MDTDLSGLHAREENLAEVRSALTAAGVEHFSVRGRWDRASVIGVSTADRERAVAVLSHLCRRLPGYLSDMTALLPGQESPAVSWPGFRRRMWWRVRRSNVIRITLYRTDPDHRVVLGTPYGCDVEFWTLHDQHLVGPRRNLAVPAVCASAEMVVAPAWSFTRLASPFGRTATNVSTRPELVGSEPDDVPFPIDVVCGHAASAASADVLRYTLRSLHMFAPWVRTVYVVTEAVAIPWLNPARVRVARELERIEELSDHFLYLCGGAVVGTDVTPDLFFYGNGIAKLFEPEDVPVHALRRDVLRELPPGSPPSAQHEQAFRTARAAPGTVRYTQIDMSAPDVDSRLRQLAAARDQHIIGLPVVGSARLAGFLASYFPLPVPYERSSPP